MKNIRKFLLLEIILVLLKCLGGFLTQSYTFYMSALFEFSLFCFFVLCYKNKENKKYKSILSSFLSFLFMMGAISLIFVAFITEVKRPNWFFLFFLFLLFFLRYAVLFYSVFTTYQKKKGLLSYVGLSSTMDFLQYGILLGSFVFSKLSFFIPILRYADRVGVLLFSFLLFYKMFIILKRSFENLYKESFTIDTFILEDIRKREEVKEVYACSLIPVGGIHLIQLQLLLKDSMDLVTLNTFMITLQDYLLKYSSVLSISLVLKEKKSKRKVRSKKENARNSRSRNRKKNIKHTNIAKEN